MLLRVRDLHTHFLTPAGPLPVVRGVTLEVARGQTVALVGESGCGKTVTALSLLGLLPPAGRIVRGELLYAGRDLRRLPDRELRALRGRRLAMIFQEPMSSLNPVLTVEAQIAEVLHRHLGQRGRAARSRVVELLAAVGLPDPDRLRRRYPHELSGGMRQRVMIAMALACGPDLLIADEPTTALDVTIQAQILALLRDLQRRHGMAVLFITHDLGVVAQVADVVCVMYAGRIVERAPTERLFRCPAHPYTRGLLRCTPSLEPPTGSPDRARWRLAAIPGDVPAPGRLPPGCPFHPRCSRTPLAPACTSQEPAWVEPVPGHGWTCWREHGDALPDSDTPSPEPS